MFIFCRNACAILEYMGRLDIPVYVGESKPIKRDFGGHSGKMVHGTNGMGEISIPEPQQVQYTPPSTQTASDFIIQKITENPGEITIIALAPLMNIAKAVIKSPEITKLTKEIIIMGGSFEHVGNISPLGEANIYNDPEAARIVLSSIWNSLVLIPLNLTHTIRFSEEYLSELFSLGNLAGKLASDVNQHYLHFHHKFGIDDCPLHDPTTILYLIAPHLFVETEKVRVYVDCEGIYTRGVTVADTYNKYRFQGILTDEEINKHGLSMIVYKTHSAKECLELMKSRLSSLP